MTQPNQFPIPPHFHPNKVGEIYRVPYQQLAAVAETWITQYNIPPAATDKNRICLLLIDVQNTFCIPEFELYVGGQSGTAAVDDNKRLCEFIYRNLGRITKIIPTLDTHTAMQIFHPIFWINADGKHPTPAATNITLSDIEKGIWQVNPAVAHSVTNGDYELLKKQAFHYVKQLSQDGKYPLTIWPYHSMLGGIGHALVSAVEEAIFYHSIARQSQSQFELKGENALTENYSILCPEVLTGFDEKPIAKKNTNLIKQLLEYDAVIIGGQAKSHCVAWTIDDLLTEIQQVDSTLTNKIYLLEDCTSPVVVSDVVDYTEQANIAFDRFAAAGMHIIKSTEWVIGDS
ncbi:isochorismatase [Sphaerospermopsis sp. FACHB-1194]|uniref:isochorismatase n=1 Tax=Sphaerospermopsis sp. FACHB-1194 TaxID=2692862 RepID=UPI001680D6A9|nr:isochorismatase [Sphaerospermopsis sp. FACHB-1194]MBD2146015.1 isochorismatase [Sphaerospermopsis sp. FACHB-1194]